MDGNNIFFQVIDLVFLDFELEDSVGCNDDVLSIVTQPDAGPMADDFCGQDYVSILAIQL